MARTIALTILLLALAARADVLTLSSGVRVEGRITRETETEVELQTTLGTVVYQRREVASIERRAVSETPPATHAGGPRGRLPDAAAVRRAITRCSWAKGVKQVPAAVVTKGFARNVPYISFHANEDYEINIYGDPAAPVAIEVGLLNMRTRDDAARKSAQAFLASLLATGEDRGVVEKLSREKDEQVREGLTFQVQPPESERSYTAWWIRVLDDRTMDIERATDEEIKLISTVGTTQAPLRRPWEPPSHPKGPTNTPGGEPWSPDEMRHARDLPEATRGIAHVYVREYCRKDGAYAKAHAQEP